jgi:hypothetical protein
VCTEAAASVPAEPASDDPWAGVIDREPGDPDMHHPDVPLAAAMLHGKQVTVHEPGEEPSTATFVADPGQYRMAAWLRREADRMIRLWRAGNLEIWSHPATTGGHAVVRIRDEEGGERYEEIRHQVYKALITAQKEAE